MLKSQYLNENDLKSFGFRSLGKNIKVSSDARIYGEKNISIGSNVRIDDFVILSASNGFISIGDYVSISRGTHLSGSMGIEIGDFVTLGANSLIYSATSDFSGAAMVSHVVPSRFCKNRGGLVVIQKHTAIAAACVITGPSNLSEGVSVGALSLVSGNLDAWGIYGGVPAKFIKERKKDILELEEEFLKSL